MNLPFWPFTLVRGGGYTGGTVPTPAEMQELQEKVAAAADGRVWTDLSLYKTWTKGDNITGAWNVVSAYDQSTRRWIVYDTPPDGLGQYTVSGCSWRYTANVSSAGGPTLAVAAIKASTTGVVIVGGQPSLASTLKIGRSIDGGDSWTRIAIGASNTNTVVALSYSYSHVMWHAAVTSEGIFSSSDGGATWVNRAATAYANFIVREGASPLILAMRKTNAGANAEYATSTDGITWTTRTFPVNLVTGSGTLADGALQGCYSEALGKFFQPTPSGIYSSPDGITWTLVTASYTTGGIAVCDRVMLRGDGKATIDGSTWYPVLETTANNLVVCASPFGGACMVDNATEERFVSLQGGF